MGTTLPIGLGERAEIEAYADFVTGAPMSVRESLGAGSRRFGSALAVAVRDDLSRFFGRAHRFVAQRVPFALHCRSGWSGTGRIR
ncbi:hypothetical protein ACFYO2_42260 [Streptomyces sp. NPDC006602]|uniref:hypothetical protein n=1 Tax=Streptomyces sp. NPDC006602 TaxID=3364751 RepID=UPI00367F290C